MEVSGVRVRGRADIGEAAGGAKTACTARKVSDLNTVGDCWNKTQPRWFLVSFYLVSDEFK